MQLSLSGILAGLLFGTIGLWLLREGKRRAHFSLFFIGLAMMLYSLFTQSPWQDWGIGLLLCALAYQQWN